MSEEEERQFEDPFLYTSVLHFDQAESELVEGPLRDVLPSEEESTAESPSPSLVISTILDDNGISAQEDEPGIMLPDIDEEEEQFGEVAEEEIILDEFILQQAREQEKQKKIASLELVESTLHRSRQRSTERSYLLSWTALATLR